MFLKDSEGWGGEERDWQVVHDRKRYAYNVGYFTRLTVRSDQISRSVVSDSFRPHESQHAEKGRSHQIMKGRQSTQKDH